MNKHSFFTLLLPLALAHCTSATTPEASSTPTSPSITFEPTLDADSGQPLPVVVGQPWVVGSQFSVAFVNCGNLEQDSFSMDYGCTTESPRVVPFDVVSASCDDDLCDVVSEAPGAFDGVDFTIRVKTQAATLHVTAQMHDDPTVTVEQDLPITATLPSAVIVPPRPSGSR